MRPNPATGVYAVRAARALVAVTLFVSAYLLFLVQPMAGRLVLPLLGGTPAVWTTCLVFFQAVLLAAYCWAHLVTRLRPRPQVLAHVGVLGLAGLILPLGVAQGWHPPATEVPVGWLVLLLLVSFGGPVFAVAGNAPVLQHWFARSPDPRSHDPYFLYAVSNVGSLLGLLTYPLVWEPLMPLSAQRIAWTAGYLALALLVAASGFIVGWRGSPVLADATGGRERLGRWRVVRWIALAAVPSSLTAGVTAFITTDLAPIPLFWVVPLAIYLVTFIASFGGQVLRVNSPAARLFPVVALPIVAWHIADSAPTWLILVLHLSGLGLVAALCHGRLAEDRPSAGRLTAFYLWIAVGGVLGGIVNAVVSPLVFRTFAEYPLVLLLAAALLAQQSVRSRWALLEWLPVVSGIAWVLVSRVPNPTVALALLAAHLALPQLRRKVVRIAAACVLVLLVGRLWVAEQPRVYAARSFFGALRVVDDFRPGYRALIHGATLHGLQAMSGEHRREPLTYFTREGPIGQVIGAIKPRLAGAAVGVVGLGAGELAAYVEHGQRWTFFEIDPLVDRVARDRRLFTFVSGAPAPVDVVLGDGRISLADSTTSYALLIVDAFSSDAVPTHLLTREAMAIYRKRLRHNGVLAFHVSNRFAELRPIVAALAVDAGLVPLSQFDPGGGGDGTRPPRSPSQWVIMAEPAAMPASLASDPRWLPLTVPAGAQPWTDEHTGIVGVLRWNVAPGVPIR